MASRSDLIGRWHSPFEPAGVSRRLGADVRHDLAAQISRPKSAQGVQAETNKVAGPNRYVVQSCLSRHST
jgi:hypothetical protein